MVQVTTRLCPKRNKICSMVRVHLLYFWCAQKVAKRERSVRPVQGNFWRNLYFLRTGSLLVCAYKIREHIHTGWISLHEFECNKIFHNIKGSLLYLFCDCLFLNSFFKNNTVDFLLKTGRYFEHIL